MEKTYSNIEKHIVIDKKSLIVDWQSTPLVRTANSEFGFFSKRDIVITCPLKPGWRLPWDNIDYAEVYNMKYHVTINPDPQCGWITSCNDLKLHNKRLKEFLREAKKEKAFKNIILVYEYGKNGKEYGKVHYHILLSTNKINKFTEMAISYFGSNNKTRWRNTVVKKPITLDRNVSVDATDAMKVENYRSQIDSILKYLKKESQNRHKCLYTNMEKKQI
jgi:hypothetical protein